MSRTPQESAASAPTSTRPSISLVLSSKDLFLHPDDGKRNRPRSPTDPIATVSKLHSSRLGTRLTPNPTLVGCLSHRPGTFTRAVAFIRPSARLEHERSLFWRTWTNSQPLGNRRKGFSTSMIHEYPPHRQLCPLFSSRPITAFLLEQPLAMLSDLAA
jgi:hypothetical protein